MFYNSFVSCDVSNGLIEKIEFFKKHSYFKEFSETMPIKSLKSRASAVALEIKRKARFLLQRTNFFFIEDINDEWSILTLGNMVTPAIVINESNIKSKFEFCKSKFKDKREMRLKYEFFALVILSMRLSILSDCFERPQFPYAYKIWEFADKISDALLDDISMKQMFDLFWESKDADEILTLKFGKKYFNSVLLALDDNKIGKSVAANLLDLDTKTLDNVFEKYIESASILLFTE